MFNKGSLIINGLGEKYRGVGEQKRTTREGGANFIRFLKGVGRNFGLPPKGGGEHF